MRSGAKSTRAATKSSSRATHREEKSSPDRRRCQTANSTSASSSSSISMRRVKLRFLSAFRKLVDQQPVESQFPHHLGELVELHRLSDIAVDTEAVALRQIHLFPGTGEHHHGNGMGAGVRLDPAQDLDA